MFVNSKKAALYGRPFDSGKAWLYQAAAGGDVLLENAPLEALEVPVIAAVNGTASEVGFELALACDFIVIADEAQIGDGRGHDGLVPGGGATLRPPVWP